ncbi:MAG: acyl-CoA dehydrogenase family protein [Pseudomonadota bacterium]
MDFRFTEEQQLLRDSIEKFLREDYGSTGVGISERRKKSRKAPGYDVANWATFADLGWLGVAIPEEYGGIGGNLIDTMVVMEELGKGLILEPYFPTVVLGANAVLLGGTETQKRDILPGVVEGKVLLALAHAEEQARNNPTDIATTATKHDSGWTLNGTKSLVLNAESATQLIVVARTSGNRADPNGLTLFLVDAKAEGISRTDYPTVDCLRASEVRFENVLAGQSQVLGTIDRGFEVLEAVIHRAILALGAEAVGMMEMLHKDTAEYTSQRVQFGHPLSHLQTVKHRIVDMFVETELTRSLLYRATTEALAGQASAAQDMHALKYKLGKAGRFVGQSAVQLHGGMGQTEDLRIGHYFIRLAAMDPLLGDKDYHLQRYVDLMDIPEGEPDANILPF